MLPAVTYYAVIGIAADDGTATTSAYTLQRLGGGALCTSDASCGETTPTEIYRGRCEPGTGACTFIEGNGALPTLAACDDDKDCASGLCSGYAFAGRPSIRSRCSAGCDGPSPLGVIPQNELCAEANLPEEWICTPFETLNRCLPRCQSDDDCPLVHCSQRQRLERLGTT